MSEKIVEFPGRGGSGPDDPGLSARVARLEEGQVRIEAALVRLEAKLDTGFEHSRSAQHRLEIELAEVKGKVGAIDGRLVGVEGRFAQIPTTMHLITLVLSIFVILGVFRFLEPRLLPLPPTVSAPR